MTPPIHLPREICTDLTAASSREWWLANGIGGFAAGTVSGVLTRRYHGLLVAPLHPPLGRFLLFVKVDPLVRDGGREIALDTNRWGSGAVVPEGYRSIEDFSLQDGLPVWRYTLDDLGIEQCIWMRHGENRTQVAYRWSSGERSEAPRLRLGLIASFRDFHCVNRRDAFQLQHWPSKDGLRLRLPDCRFFQIEGDDGIFEPDATWIEDFYLAIENERGFEDRDAHLRVGWVELPLVRDQWIGVTIGLDSGGMTELATARPGPLSDSLAAARQRIADLWTPALPGIDRSRVPPWVRQLVLAADAFVFQRRGSDGQGKTSIIAGFPWFGDWGRDTMIALPGLTLATGRSRLAREILETFAGYLSEGLLPNVFPGRGETPEYNTVDASLWFIEAWRAYFAATGDRDALDDVFANLCEIVHAYRDGTRYGIGMDTSDGLVRAGVEGTQLTWMDARVDDQAVTPRLGKPVEVNALWYNALRSMAWLAQALGRSGPESQAAFEGLATTTAAGFARFHRGGDAGLYDVLDGPGGLADEAIRPNQIFALSLPFSPLSSDALRRVVLEECRQHLLTPFGLRSLSPQDNRYSGRYIGGVPERDGSYHQGPVWGWLLGHFALAEYRVTGDARVAQERLEPMGDHLATAGLGHISEIFDGDPPHTPRGAPAQAWSLACILQAWWQLGLERGGVPTRGR